MITCTIQAAHLGLDILMAFERQFRHAITGGPPDALDRLVTALGQAAHPQPMAGPGEAGDGGDVRIITDTGSPAAWCVLQRNPRLIEAVTIADNVMLAFLGRGYSREQAQAESYRVLTEAGLLAKADCYPSQLLVREQRILATIRDLDPYADLIVVDDLLVGLDRAEQGVMGQWVRDLLDQTRGATIVTVEHEPWRCGLYADRITVLNHTTVIAQDTVHGLIRDPACAWIATHLDNMFPGELQQGVLEIQHGRRITTAEIDYSGPGLVCIHPTSIRLHRERPEGSAANIWHGRVTSLEPYKNSVRVGILGLAPLVVEVTAASSRALELPIGGAVWASVKASLVKVHHDH